VKPRPLIIKEDHALVPLTKGKFATIDLEDVEQIGKYNWHMHVKGYAIRTVRIKKLCTIVLMHRLINQTPEKLETDHKDGDKLNNRKSNLRSATTAQNQYNQHKIRGTSKFKGVHWAKNMKTWKAKIRENGKHFVIGFFPTELEAAKAYDKKAAEIFGEYAKVNF